MPVALLFAALLAAPAALAAPMKAAPAPTTAEGACALLDGAAIAKVQGSAPTASKASERAEPALTAQQCFFSLPDVSRSVSLEVTRPSSAEGKEALHERWERISGEEKEREREKKGEAKETESKEKEGEEEEGKPAKKIRGVGRPAVWSGSQRTGALYVLGKGAIVRVSVGGPGTEDEKIKRSVSLAKSVLKRLGRK